MELNAENLVFHCST